MPPTLPSKSVYGVLTWRLIVIATAIGLLVVLGCSVLVGHFGASGKAWFDWSLASIFGTALGTTALAAFTGALAYTTSGDVRATWELAALTKHDQDVRQQPLVIQVEAVYGGSPEDGAVQVRLWNAGLGPALRVSVSATYVDPANPDIAPEIGAKIWPVLAPNSQVDIALPVRFEQLPDGGVHSDGFPIRGTYLDRTQENEYEIITSWS
jgi:hypothetical protein